MALTSPIFERHKGVKLDTFSFDMARTGPASASIDAIAQGEVTPAPSAAADSNPVTLALKRFSQSSGAIKIGGTQLANVTGGRFSFSNNLERVATIRADGLIDGADETEAKAQGSIDVRFSTDTTITTPVSNKTPVALEYSYSIPGSQGYLLKFSLPRVWLPKRKRQIRGKGGIQASYEWQAAKDATAGHMLQVTLINDKAGY